MKKGCRDVRYRGIALVLAGRIECDKAQRVVFCERFECSGPGGPRSRTDEYLLLHLQTELGIKKRGGSSGVEIKGLIEKQKKYLDAEPFTGYTQTWCKWSGDKIAFHSEELFKVQKQRWLRLFNTEGSIEEIALGVNEEPLYGKSVPSNGCSVELTRLILEDKSIWWTFCLEAFGELNQVHQNLELVAKVLAAMDPPLPASGEVLSYPDWLCKINFKGNQPC
jgi:hypothetical protein